MEQLLLHLLGDYITQTNWMANNKTKSWWPAFLHAFIYTLPFFLLTHSPLALFVILFTHFLIDHFRLARYVVFFKNWLTEPTLKWEDCSATGYPSATPAFISVWLLIIADNAIHLCINYAALRWL
jgi:hypothetical protein